LCEALSIQTESEYDLALLRLAFNDIETLDEMDLDLLDTEIVLLSDRILEVIVSIHRWFTDLEIIGFRIDNI